jgi:hypothetical protein
MEQLFLYCLGRCFRYRGRDTEPGIRLLMRWNSLQSCRLSAAGGSGLGTTPPGSHRDHARPVGGTGTAKTAHTRGDTGWPAVALRAIAVLRLLVGVPANVTVLIRFQRNRTSICSDRSRRITRSASYQIALNVVALNTLQHEAPRDRRTAPARNGDDIISGDEFSKTTKPQELGRWDASQESELMGDGKVPLLSAIPMLTALSGTPSRAG